ncbi:MAG: hypothetical protein WDW36_006376 [Sanguina aurantia]
MDPCMHLQAPPVVGYQADVDTGPAATDIKNVIQHIEPTLEQQKQQYTTPSGLLLLLPPIPTPTPQPPAKSAFVERLGHQLVLHGAPFYYIGFNAHWLPDFSNYAHEWGRKRVAQFFENSAALGMRVGRCWAFNSKMPSGPGLYDEAQFESLDYVIYAAGRSNIKMILALGNLWSAYKGPEDFLVYATGSKQGKTVLDFYASPATRQLFKSHIRAILGRVNTFTGLRYADDPAIMGWDVTNEPRCPGCEDPTNKAIHENWLREMAAYVRSLDSKHLITMGTEGFFLPGSTDPSGTEYHLYNPGAGAQCEGENWTMIAGIPAVDFATAHVYERHMESLPVNESDGQSSWVSWKGCDFACYIQWFVRYMDVHSQVARDVMQKPLVLEEFGLTWWRMWEYDRKVLFKVAFELLLHSKRTNGPLMGVMFWNAAQIDIPDSDGYNVYIDRTPKQIPPRHEPTLNLPGYSHRRHLAAFAESFTLAGEPEASAGLGDSSSSGSGDSSTSASSESSATGSSDVSTSVPEHRIPPRERFAKGTAAAQTTAGSSLLHPEHNHAADPLSKHSDAGSATKNEAVSAVKRAAAAQARPLPRQARREVALVVVTRREGGRSLLVQQEHLDGFRRNAWRQSCAAEASKLWRPRQADVTVDLVQYHEYVAGLDTVDIILWASQQLQH